MTEIQGKSILVRVSARFELARVRVIGSRLYSSPVYFPSRRSERKLTLTTLGAALYNSRHLFRPKVHLPDVVCPEIKSIRSEDIHTLQHGQHS